MITVLVVNGQKVEAGLIEFPAAFGADRAMDLQRFRPVVGIFFNLAAHLPEDCSCLFGGWKNDCSRSSCFHLLSLLYMFFPAIDMHQEHSARLADISHHFVNQHPVALVVQLGAAAFPDLIADMAVDALLICLENMNEAKSAA